MNRAVSGRLHAPRFGGRWFGGRAVWLIGAALCAYTALYASWTWFHFWGDATVVSDIAPLPIGVTATALAFWASRAGDLSPRRRRAWRWIGLGCASWVVADSLWLYLELIAGSSPFPSVADGFYLAFYPLVFVGLMLLAVRQQGAKERVALALDLATVMLATLMVEWYLVAEPTVRSADSSLLSEALALAYPVGDVILILGVARLLLRRRAGAEDRMTLALLAAGMVMLALADIVYAHLDLTGEYTAGTLPDALWVMGMLGIALAALAQRVSTQARDTAIDHGMRSGVSKLPYFAVVVGLVLVLWESTSDVDGQLMVLVLGALALTVVVVARQVTVLRENERLVGELHRLANTDPLTGLANRRRFFELAPRIVTRALVCDQDVSIVMFDIDKFKGINDRFGHGAGDEVLREVAVRCSNSLRPTDLLARYGGDEFVLLLVDDGEVDSREIANRICEKVGQEPMPTTAGLVDVTISVGITSSTSDRAVDVLLQEADAALFDSKRSGRNTVSSARTPVPG